MRTAAADNVSGRKWHFSTDAPRAGRGGRTIEGEGKVGVAGAGRVGVNDVIERRRTIALEREMARRAVLLHEVRAVVFDMDGTLTMGGAIDFAEIRRRLAIPPGARILEHIATAAVDEEERKRMMQVVVEEEEAGIARTAAREDLVEATARLRDRGVRMALVTRNMRAAVTHFVDNILRDATVFDVCLDRSFHPPKPEPACILHIMKEHWPDLGCHQVVMVGDHSDDILCGQRAGVRTVAIGSGDDADESFRSAAALADASVHTLHELVDLLVPKARD
jgi:HAD superfamily hydrolase (TIGR01549 family)